MSTVSILNNIAALGASYQLGITQTGLKDTVQRLTTGSRINQASDDPSGLEIANSLTASTQIDTQGQANANNLLTGLQTMDGTLAQATDLLTRAAELAQEAQGNGAQNAPLDAEFQSIATTFNKLVSGSGGSVGITTLPTTGTSTVSTALGSYGASSLTVTISAIASLAGDLTTASDAATAATAISTALSSLGALRGNIGAGEESLQSYSNVLGIEMQNQTAQLSQIQDANISTEVVNLTKFQVLQQSGISALSKANQSGQSILTLLQ